MSSHGLNLDEKGPRFVMTQQSLVDRDRAVLWHPCAQMSDYEQFPPYEIVAAEDLGWNLPPARASLMRLARGGVKI